MDKIRILAVCPYEEPRRLLKDFFPASRYEPLTWAGSASDARALLSKQPFQVVLIWNPLKDGSAASLAREIASTYNICPVLLAKQDSYDQLEYMVRESMVFVLTLPLKRTLLMQTIRMAEKAENRLRIADEQLRKERQKFRDEKIISRCKLMLIEEYHWSEEKAHHYIEKQAMDNSMTKAVVSKTLVRKLEQRKGVI